MLSSWFGESYETVEPLVKSTFLPIFWAEERSEASNVQLKSLSRLGRAAGIHTFLSREGQFWSATLLVFGLPLLLACILVRGDNNMVQDENFRQGGSLEEGEEEALLDNLK